MQRCGGASPSGLVAVEFQEWFRLEALPAIKQLAQDNFHQGNREPWFSYKDYSNLCRAAGRDPKDRTNPMFLVAQDCDSRHSMRHFWPNIDARRPQRGPTMDRRDIPLGESGCIPIDKECNYLPSAPKVPDCIQFPIESTFAAVKKVFKKLVKQKEPSTAAELYALIQESFDKGATKETIFNCFKHAEGNMQIFAGLENETVTIGNTCFQCVRGNQLCKCRRG